MIRDSQGWPYDNATFRLWKDTPNRWNSKRMKVVLGERSQKGFPDLPLLAATQSKGVIRKEDFESRTVVAQKDLHLLKLVEVGDFVISLRSFQGGIERAHHRGIISPAYTILYPRRSTDADFLAYLFKSRPFLELLRLNVTGIREGQNIDYTRLSREVIPLPPQDEQVAIVRYLDRVTAALDDAIAAKKRLIELLDSDIDSLIVEKLLAQDRSHERIDSGVPFIGMIPGHWSTPRFASISSRRRERGRTDLDLLSVFLDRGVIPYAEGGGQVHKPSLNLDDYQRVAPGDLVLNNQQAWRGSVGVSHLEGIVSPAYLVLRMSPEVDPAYSRYLFRSPIMVDQFLVASRGVGTIQRQIYWPDLRNVRVPLPPRDEQASIAAEITKEEGPKRADEQRARRQIELLEEYRTVLIADAVTGKLDLSAADSRTPDTVAEEAVEAAAAGDMP